MLTVNKENITFPIRVSMFVFLAKLAIKTLFSDTLGFQMFVDYSNAETARSNKQAKQSVVNAIVDARENTPILLIE